MSLFLPQENQVCLSATVKKKKKKSHRRLCFICLWVNFIYAMLPNQRVKKVYKFVAEIESKVKDGCHQLRAAPRPYMDL